MCQVVPEGDAGLSVLERVFPMNSGAFIHLSFVWLARHKTDITLKKRVEQAGRQRRAVNDVGCPAWTITVTYIFAHP